MKSAWSLVLVAVLACSGTPVLAQSHLSNFMTGQVVVDDGETSLPGAVIEIASVIKSPPGQATDSRPAPRLTVTADTRGRFFVTHLPPGSYILQVAVEGFEPQEVPVTVERGKAARIDLQLKTSGMEDTLTLTAELPMGVAQKLELSEYFAFLPDLIDGSGN